MGAQQLRKTLLKDKVRLCWPMQTLNAMPPKGFWHQFMAGLEDRAAKDNSVADDIIEGAKEGFVAAGKVFDLINTPDYTTV